MAQAATGRAGVRCNKHKIRPYCQRGKFPGQRCLTGKCCARLPSVYGRILKQVRVSQGRSQAEVARSVGISAAQLARLESNQRGLYLEDFVRIAEALGEKPGNLLPNDLGSIGHLKPIIDRLASIRPDLLAGVTAIIERLVLLTEGVSGKPQRKSKPAPTRKGRRSQKGHS